MSSENQASPQRVNQWRDVYQATFGDEAPKTKTGTIYIGALLRVVREKYHERMFRITGQGLRRGRLSAQDFIMNLGLEDEQNGENGKKLISQPAYSEWESGISMPKHLDKALKRFADVLNLNSEEMQLFQHTVTFESTQRRDGVEAAIATMRNVKIPVTQPDGTSSEIGYLQAYNSFLEKGFLGTPKPIQLQ